MSTWSSKFSCCQDCGTTEIKHQAKGLCKHCYRKKWRKTEKGREARKKEYKLKQIRKKYNRFINSLDKKGKWANLDKMDKIGKIYINETLVKLPMTKEDLDYWESEYLNKDLYSYLKRKYGSKKRINRIRYIV